MENTKGFNEVLSDSANEFWSAISSYLPKLFSAILLLIVAIVFAKLAKAAVEKVLELIGLNKLLKSKSVSKTLKTAEVNVDFIDVSGRITFWVIIVIFALAIADVLGLTAMRDVIRELLGYLPNVLAAAIVLTVTVAGARLVKDAVSASLSHMRVDYSHTIGVITQYVLIIFGGLMAIDQLGFDTTILAANITLIVAGIVFALALAFGLGGRELAGRILEQAYNNAKRSKK
ncbi:MAG TPA: hypothetical protein VFX86_01480 [Candidatus Saccharimonadales bacterium]|nr:hypothetical protein [Candidatus Saccharimonadales bacterium]